MLDVVLAGTLCTLYVNHVKSKETKFQPCEIAVTWCAWRNPGIPPSAACIMMYGSCTLSGGYGLWLICRVAYSWVLICSCVYTCKVHPRTKNKCLQKLNKKQHKCIPGLEHQKSYRCTRWSVSPLVDQSHLGLASPVTQTHTHTHARTHAHMKTVDQANQNHDRANWQLFKMLQKVARTLILSDFLS